jgi:hypothetical protein
MLLNALHRHLQKGSAFAGVDGAVDFSACLPLADACNQAPEKPWSHFASQHHELRIGSAKFTDSADAHASEGRGSVARCPGLRLYLE